MTPTPDTDIREIQGIGERRARALAKLNLFSLRDLISHFPRDYEDRRSLRTIRDAEPGAAVCICATVMGVPRVSLLRHGLSLCKLRAADETGVLEITFFNQSYVKTAIKEGERYVFFGKLEGDGRRKEMRNPVFEPEERRGLRTGRILPVYRCTAGISNLVLSQAVERGLAACSEQLTDPLPEPLRATHGLFPARLAYESIHFPASMEAMAAARRRFIFEELFLLTAGLKLLKARRNVEEGVPMRPVSPQPFFEQLPFPPTNAQRSVVAAAYDDMTSGRPMNRLVQGDVGSGKTVIAAGCIWLAAQNRYQSALMAPTEILAEQHYTTLSPMLSPLRCALLTGATRAKARRELLLRLAAGEIDLLIGTHALLTEDVTFSRLGLVVADEQHRFGVRQRAALRAKGANPHTLIMSATPIPRTLAMILYGEMEVSVVDELPPGRRAVETYVVDESKRARLHGFVRRLTGEGRQVYIVCPMVEEGEGAAEELKNVTEYARALREEVFSELRVALLHGRMKAKEKEAVMAAFSRGESDILVTTTVVEVGVDVPNAALIIVENAERFGLSQLHQLRGRVGRGPHPSYCVLVSGAAGQVSAERLTVLRGTSDGFRIAEEDLRLRGPGDFFGSRQHGLPALKIADLAEDMQVLQEAQSAAEGLLGGDPALEKPEHAPLAERIRALFSGESAL